MLWATIAQSVYRLATGWTVGGSNSGGGEIFRTRPDQPWDPPNGYRVCLSGVNLPGCAADNPPQSSVEVKERVELYLYSPSGPSRPVLRRTLLLLFFVLKTGYLQHSLYSYMKVCLCLGHIFLACIFSYLNLKKRTVAFSLLIYY